VWPSGRRDLKKVVESEAGGAVRCLLARQGRIAAYGPSLLHYERPCIVERDDTSALRAEETRARLVVESESMGEKGGQASAGAAGRVTAPSDDASLTARPSRAYLAPAALNDDRPSTITTRDPRQTLLSNWLAARIFCSPRRLGLCTCALHPVTFCSQPPSQAELANGPASFVGRSHPGPTLA
jgi:hypothetical protein